MNPVIQLDPATLTLWLDLELVSKARHGELYASVVQQAAFGEDVLDLIGGIDDRDAAARAAFLASCVWHEKRHFIDLLWSNYGALRVRQYFSVYLNTLPILQECHHGGYPLVCPLDAACDPVRLEIMGLPPVGENQRRQAENVRDRKDMLAQDRTPVAFKSRPMEVGGEAQLEALAYITQYYALQKKFGREFFEKAHEDFGDMDLLNRKYRWAALLGAAVGAVPDFRKDGDRRYLVDVNLLCAMLMCALSCRVWKQKQAVVDGHSSSHLPSMRLAGMFREFAGKGNQFLNATPAAAWDAVNEAAKRLWGRSVIEELDADYTCEEAFLETFRTADYETTEAPIKCFEDYHRSRGRVIELLREAPELFLGVDAFIEGMLPHAEPITVLAKPSGMSGAAPHGWERLLGYRDTAKDGTPFQWWWAITPELEPAGEISFDERESWCVLASEHAPIAKAMLNGFAHRAMLGPEILSGVKRVESLGIRVHVDPHFASPGHHADAAAFWRLSQLDNAECDLCRGPVPKGTGSLLSPWAWRQDQRAAAEAIHRLGGGEKGERAFWQDWSVWLMCDACRARRDNAFTRSRSAANA